jgi:ankyrin repeat protein
VTIDDDFFAAMDAGDEERVAATLADNAGRADARDATGVSAVRHALYRGRADVARLVAGHATTLDEFDLAALGDAAPLRALLAERPAATSSFSEDGFTALHFAAFLGGADVARVLLDAGAPVDTVARNPMQVRPLHSAAAGRTEVCALLLAAGADVDPQQTGGYTPLHEAALNGNEELVDLFLAHGADPTITDDEGNTAAEHAQRNGRDTLAARLRSVCS